MMAELMAMKAQMEGSAKKELDEAEQQNSEKSESKEERHREEL